MVLVTVMAPRAPFTRVGWFSGMTHSQIDKRCASGVHFGGCCDGHSLTFPARNEQGWRFMMNIGTDRDEGGTLIEEKQAVIH